MVALRWLTLWFALAGAVVALAVAVMTTASVIGRAFFRAPIPGDVELTQMGIAIAISLGLPWCQMHGSNIIVDFFTQRLAERKQRLLDAAGAAFLVAMYFVLAWRTAIAPGLALAGVLALVQVWLHVTGQPLSRMHGDAQ